MNTQEREEAIEEARKHFRELLHYDPETGVFTWKVKPRYGIEIGHVSGTVNRYGYRKIKINGKLYSAHRLAWMYMYGSFPLKQIDHMNGDRDDNRISNLRESTNAENCQNRIAWNNSTSKLLGVSLHSDGVRWKAQIKVNGRKYYLGLYESESIAYEAYCAAKSRLHRFQPIPRENKNSRELIAQRTPERVEMMERKAGLR